MKCKAISFLKKLQDRTKHPHLLPAVFGKLLCLLMRRKKPSLRRYWQEQDEWPPEDHREECSDRQCCQKKSIWHLIVKVGCTAEKLSQLYLSAPLPVSDSGGRSWPQSSVRIISRGVGMAAVSWRSHPNWDLWQVVRGWPKGTGPQWLDWGWVGPESRSKEADLGVA